MQQTVNSGLNAAAFLGSKVTKVLHQLQQTASYDRMIELVSVFLQEKFENWCRPREPIDEIAIQMLDPLNNYSLEEWSPMACLSLRQFEMNFITNILNNYHRDF